MTTIKKFFYHTTGIITVGLLLQIPFSFATSAVLGDRNKVTDALDKSGIYDQLVPGIIENAEENNTDPEAAQLLKDERIKSILTQHVSGNLVQDSSKIIINGTYDWLEGKTEKPEFAVNINEAVTNVQNDIIAYGQERANSLPVCSPKQLQAISPETSVLTLPCLPPGVSAAEAGNKLKTEIDKQFEVLARSEITEKDILPKESEGQSTNYKTAPTAYGRLHNLKWVHAVLGLLLVSALIFLRKNRDAGLRYVGVLLTISGAIIVPLTLVGMKINPANTDPLKDAALNIVQNIVSQISQHAFWYGISYLLIGLFILVMKKKLSQDTTNAAPSTDNQ